MSQFIKQYIEGNTNINLQNLTKYITMVKLVANMIYL